MAKKTTKLLGLASKLGDVGRKAHEKHKSDETTYGLRDLPDGIEGGIARLVEIGFGKYEKGDNKGQFFFRAAGVILSPKTVNGRKIEGEQTSIMEPLCPTPNRSRKTVDEHLAWVYNELRKLGVDTDDLDFDDLEETVAELKEVAPVFMFRTWKGESTKQFPKPRVNEEWQGLTEFDENAAESDEVEEDETEEEVEEEVEEETKPKAKKAPAKKAPPKEEEEDEEEEDADEDETEDEGEDEEEEVDVAALFKLANKGDKSAQKKLADLAVKAGHSEDDVELAADWKAVVSMIKNPKTEDEEAEEQEDEEEEVVPSKGDAVFYRPIDPKTKKPSKKAVECEVIKVLSKAKTVTLKNLDDGETQYDSVPWSSLEQE